MNKVVYGIILNFILVGSSSATLNWGGAMANWELYLNNGVAYVLSPELPSHCSYGRAQIDMSGTDFDKSLYSYALSAKARNKKILYVVDFDPSVTTCKIYGLRESD